MSETAAAKLLPYTELHAQAELPLSNGTSLKLIGVIDLHAFHAAQA
jgi:hypothetical protein